LTKQLCGETGRACFFPGYITYCQDKGKGERSKLLQLDSTTLKTRRVTFFPFLSVFKGLLSIQDETYPNYNFSYKITNEDSHHKLLENIGLYPPC
jgi:hypothetical protein